MSEADEVPLFPASGGGGKEERSLLGNYEEELEYSKETLYRNFYIMSIAFSVNHGCAVTCLAFASTELGNSMGSATSGILYVGYAVTAFLLARPLVAALGPKSCMLIGACGYSIYVGGFFASLVFIDLSYYTMEFAWLVSCITAAVGGFSGGLLWTSQGAFFAQNSKLFCETTKSPVEAINNTFASIFATTFLGCEMVTKLFATVVYLVIPAGWGAHRILFALYSIVSLLACSVLARLDDLGVKPTYDFSYRTVSKSAGAAAKLVYMEPRFALIVPYQLAFGFASSFVPYYIFGTVISGSNHLGSTYVGVLSAVVVFTAASITLPTATIAHRYGKRYVMFIGGVCLITLGGCFFVADDDTLGTWYLIFPLLIIYGVSRGIWENTNKAVIADFFSESSESCTTAFAATAFFNGYAGALAYFIFLKLPRQGMAATIVISATFGMICYSIAFLVNDQKRLEAKIDKKALVRSQYLKYKEAHPHSLASASEEIL